MKSSLFLLLAFFLFFMGCSKDNIVTGPPVNKTGGALLRFDKVGMPSNVSTITIKLSRTGFADIIRNINILTDTTAQTTIENIAIGTWHLKIDAKNANNLIIYTGETDVLIQDGVLLQLNITLNPVNTGVGSIQIFITWGTNTLQWIDYVNNPVLNRNSNPSNPGSIKTGAVLYDNGIYKMWYYCVYAGGWASIWYAESNDGILWTTIGNSAVLTSGNQGAWDGFSVWSTAVIKENNLYKLFYGGYGYSYNDIPKMGVAVSIDGIHWEKSPNPVFSGTGSYTYSFVTSVIKKDSVYYGFMDYRSTSVGSGKIGYITSSDGINWSTHPLFSATLSWEAGGVYFPSVVYANNKYHMTYTAKDYHSIGYAVSLDGIIWEKQNTPILTSATSTQNWDALAYPQLIKVGNELKIYYTGEKFPELDGFCLLRKVL